MSAFVCIDPDQRVSTTLSENEAGIRVLAGEVVLRDRGFDTYLIGNGFTPKLTPDVLRRAQRIRPHLVAAAFAH